MSTKDEFLIKAKEEISEYGKRPEKRTIEELLEKGVANIDKPAGPTSFQVTDYVKKILGAKKAGHAGTLDPNVSGVLVIGINSGTKALTALLASPKEYVCLMRLHEKVSEPQVKKALEEFTGEIFQTPPVRAAVLRALRIRKIHYNNLLEISGKDILFRVGCDSGTYIRRLCHDIGLSLNTGAHMQQLRRTKTGSFDEGTLVKLQDLVDAHALWKEDGNEKELRKHIQPMENCLQHLPKIVISDRAVNSLAHGAQLAVPGILSLSAEITAGGYVGVFTQKGEGVMLGKALMGAEEIYESGKGIAIKTERILIEPDIYPRFK